MIGRVPYGTEERSLKDIPMANPNIIFGIVKNGTLSTNGQIDDSKILKPVDMSNKEGRMYLLVQNGKGSYSPAAVRIKHFNSQEFNIKDATVSATPMGRHIIEDINQLADVTNDDELKDAIRYLSRDLYTGDLHIDLFSNPSGLGIRFTKVERDTNGKEIYTNEKTADGKNKRKETVKVVYLKDTTTEFEITGDGQVDTSPA